MIVVVLVLLALAVGVVAGFVSGGSLRHLRDDPPIRSRLILTALGLYVMGVAGSWAWQPLLAGSTAAFWAVLAFYAWLNRRRHGARLIAFGLGLNALVILLNGAMPISTTAQARAGAQLTDPTSGRVTITDDTTTLPWLGKNIPVAFPPSPEVVSPGDIAVAAGAATVLATGMVRRMISPARPVRPAVPAGPGDPAPPGRARMEPDVDVESEQPPPRAVV